MFEQFMNKAAEVFHVLIVTAGIIMLTILIVSMLYGIGVEIQKVCL